jgi:hypothetical protein
MRTLRKWLDRLRPARAPRQSAPGSTAVAALVFALVVVVVLSVLVIRRRRLAAALPAGEPQRPLSFRRDEDPLSRGTSEWERHAAELAAARRWREAIRAWYHAVLVSLFRHGLLHHQKGRTNWEYVARLEPGLRLRSSWSHQSADREWYGRHERRHALAECARPAQPAGGVRGAEIPRGLRAPCSDGCRRLRGRAYRVTRAASVAGLETAGFNEMPRASLAIRHLRSVKPARAPLTSQRLGRAPA